MKRSFTAVLVVMMSMLYAVYCQAQILGTGQLGAARRAHTATLLQDGKILIVGGDNENGMVGPAEIFDPAALTSSNIAANPIALRTDHTATLLADGRVLIIGGVDSSGALASSEFYNPNTVPAPSFSAGPMLTRARSGHTATVLADSKILIVGGDASGSAEIYNPATESFSLIAGSMVTGRKFHSAILASSGQVLIVGGVDAQNTMLKTAEVFDPTSQSFYLPPTDMQTPRALATMKLLPDGKVQIIGGDAELSMEVFDPNDGIFIAKALLPPNADLLVATLSTQSRAALFSPFVAQDPLLQGAMTPEQSALLNRADQSITELPSRNQALVAGGINSAGQILSSAKLVSSSSASITTDKTDYAPGQIVTITGSGFQPNEQVHISFHEFPEEYPDIFFSAVANQQGNFVVAEFAPQEIDVGRIFTLTAIGQSSAFVAQTAFKDSLTINVVGTTLTANGTTVPPGVLTVSPGATISATVSVTGATGGGSSSWGSTSWKVGTTAPPGTTCVNTNDHTAGTNSESFSITAPITPGTYNAYFIAHSNNSCGGTNSVTFSLNNIITVAKATPVITFGVAPTPNFGGGNFTVSATTTNSDSSTLTYSRVSGPCALVSGATFSSSGAGICVVRASGAETANFLAAQADQSVTIAKAASVTTVTCGAGPFTYNGSAHTPCSAAVTGPGGLSESLTVNYTDNVNAGTATASANYAETANHLGSSDSKNFTIAKAASVTTVSLETGPYVYRGTAFTATAVVTGVGGLNQAVAVVYSGDCLNVTSANGCTATATYAGDANHNGSSDNKSITITKANATVTVSGYTGVYDGYAHGASGTATGVLGENLSGSLNLGGTFTLVPGGTVNWTFTDVTGNYNNQSGSVNIVISTAFAYDGFYSPIGGYGGSYTNPVKSFKLGSTIPVKFGVTWLNSGAAVITCIHTLQAIKYSNAIDWEPTIDATPTDSATTGNQFRLTGTDWHFNLSTKGKEFSAGTWLLIATLQDGSQHKVWITLKK